MGRGAVLIIIISAFLVGGSFYWIRRHSEAYQRQTLRHLIADFQTQQGSLTGRLPVSFSLNASDTWDFRFKGDELWILAPRLQKNSGAIEASDFNLVRNHLLEALESWLARHPGDIRRFPLHLEFQNETQPNITR